MGQMFFRQRTQKLYMRSDAHGERAQKVYALDYCAASFVTEGELPNSRIPNRARAALLAATSGQCLHAYRCPCSVKQ